MDREDSKMAGNADQGQGGKGGRFFGSLREALAAAGRDDAGDRAIGRPVKPQAIALPATLASAEEHASDASTPEAGAADEPREAIALPPPLPSAAEVAREARASQTRTAVARPERRQDRERDGERDRHVEFDSPPTTRVVRGAVQATVPADDGEDEAPQRTQLVRGHAQVKREGFQQDPVVGWLVVVGGPGLGMFRPIFEGNNTVGRAPGQRIPIDFGDTAISSEEQAYIRYDSIDRSFLFVPNLAKTNVVRINDSKPTGAVPLTNMDVITMGKTQLVFVPFCGADFDWSELSDLKD